MCRPPLLSPLETNNIGCASICNRFGATIVPVSGIGSEDGVEMLLDQREIRSLPIVGDIVRRRLADVPQARR